jgi:hypothetical protein
LDQVVDTEIGKLGHLNCWENVRTVHEPIWYSIFANCCTDEPFLEGSRMCSQ